MSALEKFNTELEGLSLGRCWAAVSQEQIVGLIGMTVPLYLDVDYEEYRRRAMSCLEMIGEVQAGELYEIDGQKYFAKRLTHKNRGKNPRKQKLLHLVPWFLSGLGSAQWQQKTPVE